jgi:hypothetical protein
MAWIPEFEKKLVGKKAGIGSSRFRRYATEDYCLPCRAPLTIIAAKAGSESGHFSSLATLKEHYII